MIRTATYSDAWEIAEIYNYYVKNTSVTTELECVTPYKVAARMEQCGQVGPWLVYENNGITIGYACISEIRGRKACDHSVESTIYVKNGFVNQGIGFQLYSELMCQAALKYEVIIAGIALSNVASIRFHEKLGFRKIVHFSEAAQKFGEWIEIGFWQKLKGEKLVL